MEGDSEVCGWSCWSTRYLDWIGLGRREQRQARWIPQWPQVKLVFYKTSYEVKACSKVSSLYQCLLLPCHCLLRLSVPLSGDHLVLPILRFLRNSRQIDPFIHSFIHSCSQKLPDGAATKDSDVSLNGFETNQTSGCLVFWRDIHWTKPGHRTVVASIIDNKQIMPIVV